MENPLELPVPDDPSERVIAIARDLAYGALHEMWLPEISVFRTFGGNEDWATSSERSPKIGDYLRNKWGENHPSAELLASLGYLMLVSSSPRKYMVSQTAYALLKQIPNNYINPIPDKSRTVFVVHGRETRIRNALFEFLRSISLHPLSFQEAKLLTGKASPLVPEVLDIAFSCAQAFVVLMTPEDEARLRSEYHDRRRREPHETQLTPQARPNVLFEAGMAMGRGPGQTVFVEIGELRPFTDLAGRLTIRMDNTPQKRQELIDALISAECRIDIQTSDWQFVGNFEIPEETKPTPVLSDDRVVLTPDDIVNAFRQIPDFPTKEVQENCQGLYVRLKYNLIDTRQQVYTLAGRQDILDALRTLYKEELKREDPFPLDPFAVVTWGAFLFNNGLNEQTIAWIREQLRQSSEYKDKHRSE